MWRRLVVTYGAVICLSLMALSVFLYGSVYAHLLRQQGAAQLMQTQMATTGLGGLTWPQRRAALSSLAQQMPGRLLLVDADGAVVYDAFAGSDLPADLVVYQEVQEALQGQPGYYYYRSAVHDLWVMQAAAPVWQGRQVVGAVVYAQNLAGLTASLRQLLLALAIGGGSVLLLTVVLSSWVAKRLTRPVEQLNQAVQRLAQGEPHQPLQPRGNDELAALMGNFNVMGEKLARLEQQRRQFLSDAAHELRTPLASLQALLEPLAEGPPQPPQRYREFLQDGLVELQRLNGLVEDLLQVNRLQGTVHLQKRPLAPSLVVAAVVRLLQPIAASRDINLRHVALSEPVQILADEEKLKQVLVNLIDNAVKHSPAGTEVIIREETAADWYQVTVEDEGAGIAADDLEHIFERFYRGDRARQRDTGGSGLGLAIAQRIVELHAGSISAESEMGRGSRFTVRLPIGNI